jgi:arylsulfatase A-like enzyme
MAMNIILVIADTLRMDHLPCYGNRDVIAPHLDAFSQKALIFEDCYASSFPTVPARADIFTGRFTFTYLNWGPLPQDEITLAQRLSEAGIMTFGVADTPFLLRSGYGYDRGFKDFLWIRGQRSGPEREDYLMQRRSEEDYFAPRTFKSAIEWLERHGEESFFLYIDTWDPHEPWDPPEYYVRPYLPGYQGQVVDPCYWDWREDGYSERELEIAHACYCGEISMVDRWFGILMERLDSLRLTKNTAMIFTSDHGFYFGEHGQFGKRRFRWPDNIPFEEGFSKGLTLSHGSIYRSPLHPEVTRIPLLMSLPDEPTGRVRGLATLPDLMPTVLELAGVEPPDTIQAPSLLPLIRGKSESPHEIIVTSTPLEELGEMTKTVDDHHRKTLEISPSTITDGEWDLLYATQGEPIELYHSKSDPRHELNVARENTQIVERLHEAFLAFLENQGTAEESLQPRRLL